METIAKELEWETYEVVQEVKGEALDRLVAQHPFYDRESLVMVGEHVTAEAGTGCVHTATGHGKMTIILVNYMIYQFLAQLIIVVVIQMKRQVLKVSSIMMQTRW